jgi:hypothetical protein
VAATVGLLIKVSQDNSTAGGTGTPGTPLDEAGFGGYDFNTWGQLHRTYPNKLVTQRGTYIKIIVDNQTAGAIQFHVIVAIEFLD